MYYQETGVLKQLFVDSSNRHSQDSNLLSERVQLRCTNASRCAGIRSQYDVRILSGPGVGYN